MFFWRKIDNSGHSAVCDQLTSVYGTRKLGQEKNNFKKSLVFIAKNLLRELLEPKKKELAMQMFNLFFWSRHIAIIIAILNLHSLPM